MLSETTEHSSEYCPSVSEQPSVGISICWDIWSEHRSCLSAYVSRYLCVKVSTYQGAYLHPDMWIFCPSVWISVDLNTHPSFRLSGWMSVCWNTHVLECPTSEMSLSVCNSIHLSEYLSVRTSILTSMYLMVWESYIHLSEGLSKCLC